MEKENKPIRFVDLSMSLKTFVILGWGVIGIYGVAVMLGIISAMIESV